MPKKDKNAASFGALNNLIAVSVRPLCMPQDMAETAILVDALRIYAANPKLRAKVVTKQPDCEQAIKGYLLRVGMALQMMSVPAKRPTKAKAKK